MYNRRQPLCGVVIFYFKIQTWPIDQSVTKLVILPELQAIHCKKYSFQPIFVHLTVQCSRIDAEQFCRFFPVAACGFESLDDGQFFFCHAIIIDRICRYGIRIDADIHALRFDDRFFCQQHGPFYLVLQLPDVPRPFVGKEKLLGFYGKSFSIPSQFGGRFFPEKFREWQNVFGTLA